MRQPWDRLDEESDLAFQVFNEWMLGSPSIKSPLGLSGHMLSRYGVTVSPNTIVQWRGLYGWKRRASAWLNHTQAERLKMVSQAIGQKSALLSVKHFRGRELAIQKTIRSLKRLEDENAEDQDKVQSVIRKAIENLGNCVLDHDNQLRRLSAGSGSAVDREPSEAEEVIPPIPFEPGCLQQSDPETETLLGTPEGDLPGDS